ncbi:hypothetical protein FLBR109950_16070 [Flavobacterium branchiophilum]
MVALVGTKVADAAVKVPPVPLVLVQTPPDCSPVIKSNKLIAVVLFSQTVVLPSVPALATALTFTVAKLESSGHGEVPVMV